MQVLLAVLLAAGSASSSASRAQLSDPERVRIPRVLRVPADFSTIQRAIDRARDGDVVLVAPGRYRESIDFRGKAIEVLAFEGAGRTSLGFGGPAVKFANGEGSDSVLSGFTITGGLSSYDSPGGGISCVDALNHPTAPLITDCIIEHNGADFLEGASVAGGVYGNPILERCILRQNNAFVSAGALYGAPILVQCLVENNTACRGAGMQLFSGARLRDCLIRGNRITPCVYHGVVFSGFGGGIETLGDDVRIEGCVLTDNVIDEFTELGDPGSCRGVNRGGAVSAGSGVTLARCTIYGNSTEQCAFVGGIEGAPTLVDCIVRGNEDPSGYYA